MVYSIFIGFTFYTDCRKTYYTPSGINPVGPQLSCDNSEDKLDQADWYALYQCFAAWDHNSFNHVLGTLKQNFLSRYCPTVQVCAMLLMMLLKKM